MDDRVPEHRDSYASSSHELSLEPTSKRSEDLGKHSVYTHFPQNRKCEIWQRTKITRAPCRRSTGGVVPRAEKFGDLSRAQSSQWKLWISKQSSICSRGAGLGHLMDPVVSVQNKNFARNTKKLAKVPGAREEAESHLHWQFLGIWQSSRRSVLESLYVDTTQIGNKMGLLKEQCAEWRKVLLLYCYNRV